MTQQSQAQTNVIFRRPRVQADTGNGRSTLYQRIAQGLFTKPVRLGGRSVGWPALEVAAINAARISGRTDEEIRALVIQLHAARTDLGRMRV